MANISAYAEKAALDWLFNGATPTRPTSLFMGLSLGTPSSTSGSEVPYATYTRQPIVFSAAVSPGGSAVNTAAISFQAASTAGTYVGYQIWDTQLTNNSGHMLWYGTLSTAASVAAASAITFAAGSVALTLA